MSKPEKSKANRSWKEHLLRSGLPLEYEIAQLLVAHGMEVTPDFPYARREADREKEFSIDTMATWTPEKNKRESKFILVVLIESKHRSREKSLMFVQDPNKFGIATLGGTTAIVDSFCPFHLSSSAFSDMELLYPFVHKGVEVHPGGAHADDLRQGISQLRYATPAALIYWLELYGFGAPDDAIPIFFTKILATNAPVWVLNHDISVRSIEDASEMADVASLANAVVYYSDYGPDYETHFKNAFKRADTAFRDNVRDVRDHVMEKGKKISRFDDPTVLLEELAAADRMWCRQLSCQFFVSTLDGLPSLVDAIKEACVVSYQSRTKKDPFRRKKR